jgi:hypothetical protein
MTDHTPGPWRVEEGAAACFHRGNRFAIVYDVDVDAGSDEGMTPTVAEVWVCDDLDTERADARVIAAAPKMLGVLLLVEEDMARNSEAGPQSLLPEIREAIAAAREGTA